MPRAKSTCDRTACDERRTHVVKHNKYDVNTHACEPHARWWVRGVHGVVIGTMTKLEAK